MDTSENTVRVWDPLVRIGHWTLVAAFFTAYFTEDDFLTQHVWAGYVVGAVVLVRIAWGFVGPQHARFADFVRSPSATFGYLRELIALHPRRYLGHNPAGAAMIVTLLISVSATVYTGLVLYAVEDNAGPLAPLVADQAAPPALPALVVTARAQDMDDDEHEASEEEREEFWEELHEFFANLTLALVVLHVAGMFFSAYLHRENLVKAMITGRKRVD